MLQDLDNVALAVAIRVANRPVKYGIVPYLANKIPVP